MSSKFEYVGEVDFLFEKKLRYESGDEVVSFGVRG